MWLTFSPFLSLSLPPPPPPLCLCLSPFMSLSSPFSFLFLIISHSSSVPLNEYFKSSKTLILNYWLKQVEIRPATDMVLSGPLLTVRLAYLTLYNARRIQKHEHFPFTDSPLRAIDSMLCGFNSIRSLVLFVNFCNCIQKCQK